MTPPSRKTDQWLLGRWLMVVLVVGGLVAYGLQHFGPAPDLKRLRRAEGVAAACLIYASDHTGYLPSRLADLLPNYAPAGVMFTGFSPEAAIKGYAYLGSGVRITDNPGQIILQANDPTSEGGRIVVFLSGKGAIQAVNQSSTNLPGPPTPATPAPPPKYPQ